MSPVAKTFATTRIFGFLLPMFYGMSVLVVKGVSDLAPFITDSKFVLERAIGGHLGSHLAHVQRLFSTLQGSVVWCGVVWCGVVVETRVGSRSSDWCRTACCWKMALRR